MRFLYRYYGNFEYALDVIKNKRIYFSLPSDFYDPFDCKPKFSLLACKNDGVESWIELLKLIELYVNPTISENALNEKVKETLAGKSHPSIDWLKSYEYEKEIAIRTLLSGIRICCFTKSPRNQMLWAHYAKNHRGVVFQFRTKYMADGNTGEAKMFPVTYCDKPIRLRQYIEIFKAGQKDPLEYARFQYCSKSQEWSSEDEVRFFSKYTYVPFPERMLTGIIFGSKTPKDIINEFKGLREKWHLKPNLFAEKDNQARHKQVIGKIFA
jgi:hypothetical protein